MSNLTGHPMQRISVHRRQLHAGDQPWRAWGFNWGAGRAYPLIRYFDNPTPAKLDGLSGELGTARRLGANSMRIYLELGQVMETPKRARRRALAALRKLLAVAESAGIYLDITGNLVWRPKRVPRWYELLRERERWEVQARFWKAVARVASGSPAVLCYELTSEPVIGEGSVRYLGELDGWTFIQSIVQRRGRDARRLARNWTYELAAAVRSEDDRPVTIGFLPFLHGPFAPANLADLLDMLVVHAYPQHGSATADIELIRRCAAFDEPVLIGETFPLFCDKSTQREFLLGANHYTCGVMEFFDGRDPDTMRVSSVADAVYQSSLTQFASLRDTLLRPDLP
jgi:hypothetical protein